MTVSLVGPLAMLLLMTGHEQETGLVIGATALLNLALNALLIPSYGLNGAAIATAISHIAWVSILLVLAKKRLGILALPSWPKGN